MDPNRSTLATSHSLIEQVQDRNADAWLKLHHLYSPLVHCWARRAGVIDEDAADIAQEVFRIVAGSIQRFRHDRPQDTFRGWLLTITRNELRAHFRKQSRQAVSAQGGSTANYRLSQAPDWMDEHDPLDSSVVDPSVEKELMRRAAEIVRHDFESHTWQAFWRCVVEGHLPADVAHDLNMKPNAVRQAKFRVLARLKETIGEL